MGIEEDNAKFFDSKADWYDSNEDHKKLHTLVTSVLKDDRAWISKVLDDPKAESTESQDVRLLDYACGTGIVSRALAPYVTSIRGIDLSPGMIKAYNARISELPLSPPHVSAVVGNILKDPVSSEFATPEYTDLDVAAIGLGFHHFPDPTDAAKRLVQRLKPGGALLIIDALGGGEHEHKAWGDGEGSKHRGITKHGFTEEEMKVMFEEAGCGDFGFKTPGDPITVHLEDGKTRVMTVFFARGTKL